MYWGDRLKQIAFKPPRAHDIPAGPVLFLNLSFWRLPVASWVKTNVVRSFPPPWKPPPFHLQMQIRGLFSALFKSHPSCAVLGALSAHLCPILPLQESTLLPAKKCHIALGKYQFHLLPHSPTGPASERRTNSQQDQIWIKEIWGVRSCQVALKTRSLLWLYVKHRAHLLSKEN